MRYLLLTLLLAFASWSQGAEKEVTVNASGFGETPRDATAQALVEASRQALGVNVTLDPTFRKQVGEWIISQNGNSTLARGNWSSRPEAKLPTLASLRGYRVLDTVKIEDSLWRADVEARVLTLDQGERANLSTLVVAPFATSSATFHPGRDVPAAEVRARLQQELVSTTTAGGKLRVLDREFDQATAEEQAVAAGSINPEEQVKRGQALGADFLLVGTINEFRLGEKNQKFYGITFNTLEPRVSIDYRLIKPATREVLAAGTFNDRKLPETLKQAFKDEEIDPERDPESIDRILYPRVARGLTEEVMGTLFPMRILSVRDGKTVHINAGSGRLQEGDLLSVHEISKTVQDPDTNMSIRVRSPVLATVRVVQTQPQYTTAEVVTGSVRGLADQAFVRLQARPEKKADGPLREKTPGSSEAPIDWD
jgi:hypothetical protein